MTSVEKLYIIIEKIRTAIAEEKISIATAEFLDLHPADQADVFNMLEEGERLRLLKQLDIGSMADLFDELEDQETLEAAENDWQMFLTRWIQTRQQTF